MRSAFLEDSLDSKVASLAPKLSQILGSAEPIPPKRVIEDHNWQVQLAHLAAQRSLGVQIV